MIKVQHVVSVTVVFSLCIDESASLPETVLVSVTSCVDFKLHLERFSLQTLFTGSDLVIFLVCVF